MQKNIVLENNVKLIINADDLGICKERDKGIFELFEKGFISSSSIIINGVNFDESIKIASSKGLPLGLHINLTEGEPINRQNISTNSLSYFDQSSFTYKFFGKFNFREKINRKEIKINDVTLEIYAQVNHINIIRLY